MAYWDGDRWLAETDPEPANSGRRAPRWLRSPILALVMAALVVATQAGAPVSLDRTSGTIPWNEQQAAAADGGTRVPLARAARSPGAARTTPAKAVPPPNVSPKAPAKLARASSVSSKATAKVAPARIASPKAPAVVAPASIVSPKAPAAVASGPASVYLHYYLWWTQRHWHDKLGAAYPYSADPLPLPGRTDAAGCGPTVSYPGSTIVDIPSQGLYDQASSATFDSHIATAVAYGITGFVADWAGTGSADQTPSSSGYNARLDLLVRRVDAWNAGHDRKFRLALDFAAFGKYSRPAGALINDLRYFAARYGTDPAFTNRFSTRPLVMIIGSRKYPLATIEAVSAAVRPSLFLLGDETYSTLSRDLAYLDGSSYYWSSESPSNSGAKKQIASLGSQLHAAGKPWIAPFTAGYDSVLVGGHCVPRNGLATLDTIWSWNSASGPDAWFGISWNEYVENTHLEPSLKYGARYLAEIARLAGR